MIEKIKNFALKKPRTLGLLLIFSVWIFSYAYLPFIFFIQDEWLTFELILANGKNLILRGFLTKELIHFIPITNLYNYLAFNIFGFRYWLYNLVGLFIHSLNGYLIFLIVNKISKQFIILNYLSVVFFYSLSISFQLIYWPLINFSMLSLTLCLIVYYLLLDFYYKKNGDTFWKAILIYIILLMSLLIIESAIGLFIFILIFYFISLRLKKRKINWIFLSTFILASSLYLLIRLVPIFSSQGGETGVSFSKNYLDLFFLPFRYIGQVFGGQGLILFLSRFVGKLLPFLYSDVLVETKIFKIISFFWGLIISILTYLIYLKNYIKYRNFSVNLIMSLVFIACFSFSFFLVPGEATNFSIFEPRYLYYGSAGLTIYMTLLLKETFIKKTNKTSLSILVIVLYIVVSGTFLNFSKGKIFYSTGNQRKKILNIIKDKYPTLSDKTIFYTESDSSYFGLEEKIMPFQTGFGLSLLIWYYPTNKYDISVYENSFLWSLKDQGYKEKNGHGFGYFRDKNMLEEAIKKYNLSRDSIIAFSWKGKSQTLEDITQQVRANK